MRPPKVSSVVHVPQLARIGNPKKSRTFVVPAQIQIDGLGLQTKALCDTGADISLSVSPMMALRAVKHLNARIKRLCKPIPLADYRRKPLGEATHQLIATFELDNRRFKNQRFLIIDTGYNVFIGQEWFSEQNV